MARWARLAIFFAGLLLANAAHALDPGRSMSQYLSDRWGTQQGLPRAPVYAIAQTADGYLWIGTGAGLIRFDGFSFRVIKDEAGVFAISSVPELAADNQGCLWVRLQNLTLLQYCNGKFTQRSSGPGTRASALSRTGGGEILIANPQEGALAFRADGFRVLAPARDLSRTPVTALAQTSDGDIWMGTREAGVFRFVKGNSAPPANWLRDIKINALLPDGDRGLWIATDDGIRRWNGRELTVPEGSLVRG